MVPPPGLISHAFVWSARSRLRRACVNQHRQVPAVRCRTWVHPEKAWRVATAGDAICQFRLRSFMTSGGVGPIEAALLSVGRRIAVGAGRPIQSPAPASADCYFVESGLASLCFGDAGGIEVGMVGAGGIIGLQSLFKNELVPITAVATVASRLIGIPTEAFGGRLRSAHLGLEFLHAAVSREWAQTAILARCNAEHSVQARVARWTLTAHHHVGDYIGPISHDRLASFLGVRRASATVALHELEGEGAIRSSRSFLEVRDRATLGRLSCQCGPLIIGLKPKSMGVSNSASASVGNGPRAPGTDLRNGG